MHVVATHGWAEFLTLARCICQAFEPRVGGYNSSDSIDVGRAEDELLQRLHRLDPEPSSPARNLPGAVWSWLVSL